MSFRRQYKQAGTGETSSRWAWPPGVGGGGVGAAGGPRGGSLSALDLLDRSFDEPDAGWPQTEAELAKLYQSTIMEQQQRHLEPLREDLADWLNKILGEFAKKKKIQLYNKPIIASPPSTAGPSSYLFIHFHRLLPHLFFSFQREDPLSFVTYVYTHRQRDLKVLEGSRSLRI